MNVPYIAIVGQMALPRRTVLETYRQEQQHLFYYIAAAQQICGYYAPEGSEGYWARLERDYALCHQERTYVLDMKQKDGNCHANLVSTGKFLEHVQQIRENHKSLRSFPQHNPIRFALRDLDGEEIVDYLEVGVRYVAATHQELGQKFIGSMQQIPRITFKLRWLSKPLMR